MNPKNPQICIIVPVFNRIQFTIPFIDSVQSQIYKQYKLIIIDDNSTDGTYERIKNEYGWVEIIRGNGNWWWTKSINIGIDFAEKFKPDYVLCLNDDLLIPEDYLLKFVENSEKFPDTIQCSISVDVKSGNIILPGKIFNQYFGIFRKPNDYDDYQKVNMCYPGRGLWIPYKIFNKVRFDEKWFPQTHADYDFTLNCQKLGFKVILNKDAVIFFYPEETHTKKYFSSYSIYLFVKYLTEIKSACALITITRFRIRHVKIFFLPIALMLGYLICIGGYLKRYVVSFFQ